MKNVFYILLIFTTLFIGCQDDLSKEAPFLSEESVFEEEALTEASIAALYSSFRFMELGGGSNNNLGLISNMGGEYTNFAPWQVSAGAVSRTYSAETGSGALGYWGYGTLRSLNVFIDGVQTSSSFSQEYINTKLSEARFLRAYLYFEMAKRYGGVPIILKAQNIDDPQDELYPARNTEKEVYDLIYSELEDIKAIATTSKTGAFGQVDLYTIISLQSRAMLYAASIANFGEVKIDGLVGIPAADATSYYQKSYNASKELMDSGKFSLFNKYADKVDNFSKLFLEEGDSGNPEIIFAEVFEPYTHGHGLDVLGTPDGFLTTWNSNFPVNYDIVEQFEFMDGRPDIERSELTASARWDVDDFFGNRDPRLRASIFYPESIYQGQTVYFHVFSVVDGKNIKSGNVTNIHGEEIPALGPKRLIKKSGLLLRKKLDLGTYEALEGASGQDMYVFRYGETLLNHAEAAFYLNKNTEASASINELRERAGMFTKASVTEADIRRERQVELAFEDHRYWDVIRWRIASTDLNKAKKGCIFKYYPQEDKYSIVLKNDIIGNKRLFGEERYYLPISTYIMADNPKILQNPGY
ncbi:MAG: hypothetical protein COB60_01000 [Flavobacteriaceae bacterium]|nr:MAG: hypothetical protein COB60_01000 [Flavobacteriaceae bacterium]